MKVSAISLLAALALAASAACSERVAPEPAESLMSEGEPRFALTPLEVIALEDQPGVTDPIPVQIEEPGPAHPDLEGAPGPSPAAGPEDAPVRIYLFTDLQCPICSRTVEPIKELVRSHPEVRVIFKHYALEMHSRSAPAAAAAIAADRQGRFSEFYDASFAERGLRDDQLLARAETLGLDMERFRADLADVVVRDQVRYETAMAKAMGISGTPALYVNGKLVPGWASYGALEADVKRASRRTAALKEEGVSEQELARIATRTAGDAGAQLAEFLWGPSDVTSSD